MSDLPSGTVTFLFTDIEGSTRLLHELGAEGYAGALSAHRRVLREAFDRHGGVEVDTQGDAFFVAFPTAPGALQAAAEGTERLAQGPIRVRMGIHTGTPHVGEEGYVGVDVNRAARIAACGHGGQVLASQTTAALTGTEGLRDLGEHRLKDLSAPERIYQLGDGEFPPLKSLHRTNLPVPATPFLGRERELHEVHELVSRPGVRLVTLTGPGGTGKTRLALQAAAAQAERFPDGVWWVPLGSLRDPQLVLEEAGQVLDSENGLAGHIADKRLLLLFDNFEQVVEAAPGVAELLEACPNLEVLVTSREPLRLAGEREYPVPTLAEREAVALFLERTLSAEPEEAVRAICQRLDCLPLAVELAAARTRALSTEQILARLEQRLPLLSGGPRDAPERQRTLRATIEWSHGLLSVEEQQLFARLAIFAGGCTLGAAEQVCDADLDRLQSLVEKSLVKHTDERFWMLETIHEYARERLGESGEREELRQQHFSFFLAFSARATQEHDELDSAAGLEPEQDNFRMALDCAREAGERELELRLAVALGAFWHDAGHLQEGRRRLVEALSECPEGPQELRGVALNQAAWMARKLGDLDDARTLANEALSGHRATGDARGLAESLNLLGVIALAGGHLEQARALCEEAKSLREQLGDQLEVAKSIHNLAILDALQGHYDDARRQLESELALVRKLNARRATANTLGELGFVALAQGHDEEGRGPFEESLRLSFALGWKEGSEYSLIGLAAVNTAAGRFERAARLMGAAGAVGDEIQLRLEPYVEEIKEEAERKLFAQFGEETFAEHFAEGRALSLDEAVGYALSDQA